MALSDNNPLKDIYGIEDIIVLENTHNNPPACGDNQSTLKPKLMSLSDKTSFMDKLRSELESCQSCSLGETRKNLVFGEGSLNARLMFIGEGPGAEEDATGRPFVGRSGQLLTKMIEAMGIKRSEVYIANIVKCRPPDNRNPFEDEANACIDNLKKQISIINPEFIVCLGSVAVGWLLKTSTPISRLRGNWKDFNGYKVMPTYHPSYLLRSPNKKSETWHDLKLVMKAMGLEIANK